MSPNDDSESENFIFINNPVQSLPQRDDRNASSTFDHAVDTDYVTVNNDNPIISTDQDVVSAPLPDPYMRIEYFEPMLLSSFPEEISQDVLMAAVPTEYEMLLLKSRGPPPDLQKKPHSRFVSNAILLFECFFHFEGLHLRYGPDGVLGAVGNACELRSESPTDLRHHVGRTLDTLRESRVAFLRLNKDKFVWRAEDANVRELARLVDRYIKNEEPREFDEQWHMDPAVVDLWSKWQGVLETKHLRFNRDQSVGASVHGTHSMESERGILVSEIVMAAIRLEGFMFRLEACGGSDGLTETEKWAIQQALNRATRWTESIQGSQRSHLQPEARSQ